MAKNFLTIILELEEDLSNHGYKLNRSKIIWAYNEFKRKANNDEGFIEYCERIGQL